MFAPNVDVTVKNLAVGLKRMQSQCMTALLNEVDAALKQDVDPSVAFQVAVSASMEDDCRDKGNVDVLDQNDGETSDDVPEAETEEDSEDDTCVGKEAEVDTSSVAIGVPQKTMIVQSSCTGGDIGG
jgi:hypothetical protein